MPFESRRLVKDANEVPGEESRVGGRIAPVLQGGGGGGAGGGWQAGAGEVVGGTAGYIVCSLWRKYQACQPWKESAWRKGPGEWAKVQRVMRVARESPSEQRDSVKSGCAVDYHSAIERIAEPLANCGGDLVYYVGLPLSMAGDTTSRIRPREET